jgi:hypothetical protein
MPRRRFEALVQPVALATRTHDQVRTPARLTRLQQAARRRAASSTRAIRHERAFGAHTSSGDERAFQRCSLS